MRLLIGLSRTRRSRSRAAAFGLSKLSYDRNQADDILIELTLILTRKISELSSGEAKVTNLTRRVPKAAAESTPQAKLSSPALKNLVKSPTRMKNLMLAYIASVTALQTAEHKGRYDRQYT